MKKPLVLVAAIVAFSPAMLLAADPVSPGSPPPGGREGQMFDRLDTNHDGVITKEEVTAAGAKRFAQSFDKLDANHDGMLTQDELRAAGEARREEAKAQLAARFKQADTNADGLLSKDEATAGMPMLARHFDKIDTNKDGQVSPEELAQSRAHFAKGGPGGPRAWKGRPPAGPVQQ